MSLYARLPTIDVIQPVDIGDHFLDPSSFFLAPGASQPQGMLLRNECVFWNCQGEMLSFLLTSHHFVVSVGFVGYHQD